MAVLSDVASGQSHPLPANTRIGRDRECEICLPDRLVSRLHCVIRRTSSGHYLLADQNSAHGTFVGGQRVQERILVEGDEIVVGSTLLRFADQRDPAAEKPVDKGPASTPAASLEVIWPRGSEFLENLEPQSSEGQRFFYPAPGDEEFPREIHTGEVFSTDLKFEDRGHTFHVHTRVVHRVDEDQRRGLQLEFLPEEKQRQELVLASARQESVPYFRRRHERIACNIAVRATRANGSRAEGTLRSLSEGGALLADVAGVAMGDAVRLTFAVGPTEPTVAVAGRVVGLIPEGPQRGAAIEFAFGSAEERDEMKRTVAIVKAAQR